MASDTPVAEVRVLDVLAELEAEAQCSDEDRAAVLREAAAIVVRVAERG